MGILTKTATITLLLGVLYVGRKLYNNNTALQGLKSKVVSIKDVSINLDRIQLTIDLKLTNTTKAHLGVDSFNLLTIKQLQFFNRQNNNLVGVADVAISGLEIASESSYTIKNIIATLPVNNILKNLELFKGNLENNIKIGLIFDSLGSTYNINSEIFK